MYSINVFLTFTLSQAGMTRFWWPRRGDRGRRRHLTIHGVSLLLCASVLLVTLAEKFGHGGWVTVAITSSMVLICFRLHRHYEGSKSGLRQLDEILGAIPTRGEPNREPLDPRLPTAVLLVGSFNGLGVHTLLSTVRFFPGLYRQFVFVSVAVVDSGSFKGREEIEALQQKVRGDLERYVTLARGLGFAAESRMETGIEIVDPATELCREISQKYPKATIISGKLVFRRERWYHGLLHNETPAAIQRRLQWLGVPMVVLPVRASV